MTKRWGPNLRSEMTKTKRSAAKKERVKAKREARKMAEVAKEYKLDPIGDFIVEAGLMPRNR